MEQLSISNADVYSSAGLAARHVRMSEEEASTLAFERHGLTGTFKRFDTEKDDTFRIDAGTAGAFVLKIGNPEEPVEDVDLQTSLLEHVERTDKSLPVPRVVPSKAGESHFAYRDRAGQHREVWLLTFLDGQPLSETTSSASEREKIGENLARLRLATADFAHPADERPLPWDVKHLLSLSGLLNQIDDPRQNELVRKGLTRFAEIQPRIAACRAQVLHNDFSRSNLVVDHERPEFVTGVIDFGDVVRTAVAIDVSTALLNQLPAISRDDIFLEGRDILRGYLRHADLTEDELALIPHLVMGRAVTRALLSIWRAKLIPENSKYILRNTEQGWVQLDWFLSRSVKKISEQLL